MALKATIFKADLQIADMDRHYYADHALTIARHPSETDERMMVRLLAFALHANDALAFGKGLSADDEPDLWQKDLTGAIDLWIDVGQPDEKSILKACGRSEQVIVYSYSATSGIWWNQIAGKVARARNLWVRNLPQDASLALAKLAQRTMRLQCTIQDGQVWLTDGAETVQIEFATLKPLQGDSVR
ncbi:YaeQ family protein [Noviherbaspirillum cavernae]|uniref:YaeQ family protein n=1 Tax=Noviherbaspirillum cavernae TaxID=2320862 RepID=A0A418X5Q9_9BURK|nr:YaeQ family protein [Noviherbaspirillum cavernae]RJG07818.1 YaeQ family protein [Noviherbaspirillum cavernae]